MLKEVDRLSKAEQWDLCKLLDRENAADRRHLRFVATASNDSSELTSELRCRIGVWTARLAPLNERHGDLQSAVRLALARHQAGPRRTFAIVSAALELFLNFATSTRAVWPQNFVELSSSVERLATFASVDGELSASIVRREILHLSAYWEGQDPVHSRVERVLGDGAQELDRIDRATLEEVLAVCVATSSMAEAGKLLFAKSRERRGSINDSDRMKKWLTRYGLTWTQIQTKLSG
jgi:transcriptional regulatory protein RtcR